MDYLMQSAWFDGAVVCFLFAALGLGLMLIGDRK